MKRLFVFLLFLLLNTTYLAADGVTTQSALENHSAQKMLEKNEVLISKGECFKADSTCAEFLMNYPGKDPSVIMQIASAEYEIGKCYESQKLFRKPFMTQAYLNYLNSTNFKGEHNDEVIYSLLEYLILKSVENKTFWDSNKKDINYYLGLVINQTSQRFYLMKSFYFMLQEDYDSALEYLKRVNVDQVPYAKSKWIYNNLGYVLMKKGKWQHALKPLQIAVLIEPTNIIARGNLAWVYVNLGNFKKAVKQYDLILEIDPKNKKALEGREDALKRE